MDGYGRAALHYAAERRPRCVDLLIAHGADVDIRDASYAMPLHWASYKNNAASVRLLLQHGADVNGLEINNDTPLSWASHRSSLESIKGTLGFWGIVFDHKTVQ